MAEEPTERGAKMAAAFNFERRTGFEARMALGEPASPLFGQQLERLRAVALAGMALTAEDVEALEALLARWDAMQDAYRERARGADRLAALLFGD